MHREAGFTVQVASGRAPEACILNKHDIFGGDIYMNQRGENQLQKRNKWLEEGGEIRSS